MRNGKATGTYPSKSPFPFSILFSFLFFLSLLLSLSVFERKPPRGVNAREGGGERTFEKSGVVLHPPLDYPWRGQLPTASRLISIFRDRFRYYRVYKHKSVEKNFHCIQHSLLSKRDETIVNPSPYLIVEPSLLYIFIKPMTSV